MRQLPLAAQPPPPPARDACARRVRAARRPATAIKCARCCSDDVAPTAKTDGEHHGATISTAISTANHTSRSTRSALCCAKARPEDRRVVRALEPRAIKFAHACRTQALRFGLPGEESEGGSAGVGVVQLEGCLGGVLPP